jgi:hypothetical protein
MPTDNTYQRGRAKEQVFRNYKGESKGVGLQEVQGDPDTVCRGDERVRERHERAEEAFLQNLLLDLPVWCIMMPDAYREHIPKEDGRGTGIQEVQGDPVII